MQLGFNLWTWTWCNISRPRQSGTLGGGTGGTCGTRCPGTFAFLEPKEFLEPVEGVKQFQAFLGFKHAMVPQVPDRFFGLNTPLVPQVPDRFLAFNHATGSTGSRQAPWVQPRHWFHSFQTGSLGSNTQWFHRFQTGSLGSTRHWFHRFQTGSLGSTTLWVQQVESKEPVWNRPRHCFTGSRQVPWVQPWNCGNCGGCESPNNGFV